jgi:chorismate mutase/prephenate dehydratase
MGKMVDETLLESLRSEIDRIDDSIVALLEKRLEVARQIAMHNWKKPVFDQIRHKTIIKRLQEQFPEMDSKALATIYEEILKMCRAVYQE